MSDPFWLIVLQMRSAQRARDADPTPHNLKLARYLERLVDVAIEEESNRPAPSMDIDPADRYRVVPPRHIRDLEKF